MPLQTNKHDYKWKPGKIFISLSAITIAYWLLALLLGEIMQPDSNLPRPDAVESIPSIFILGLITALMAALLVGYARLVRSIQLLKMTRTSYKAMVGLVFAIYVLVAATFSSLFYRPEVDEGFKVLLLPYLFFHAFWVLPLVGIIAGKFKR